MPRAIELLPSHRPIDRDFVRIAHNIELRRPGAAAPKQSPRAPASPFGAVALIAIAIAVPTAIRIVRSGAAQAVSAPRCQPVRYAINAVGAPPGVRPTVEDAFGRFGAVTRIPIVYDADRPDVVVSWISAGRLDTISHQVDALGFTIASTPPPFSGEIYLNADAQLPLGFDVRHSWGGVLLHELGHLAGLPHSPDPTEVMYPDVDKGGTAWGTTDQAQLHAAGARAGCATTTR